MVFRLGSEVFMAADVSNLSIEVNGLKFKNPFVIASGPPGTNKATIAKAFNEGWGGVVAKTISLDNNKVINVVPRYGKLYSRETKEVIGFQNIELISDRPIEDWVKEFGEIKEKYKDQILIASIMEEYNKKNWQRLVAMVQETGVDGFELNFSCPHGLPERKMGMAMGENADIVCEVTRWVTELAKVPVWAKMTPNITDITVPAQSAINGGAVGISAINTILAVIGIDLDTLRPLPTVQGFSIPGGYSAQAVRPIALRHVMELGRKFKYPLSISGMGGVENAADAIQFLLLGASTVQVCTAAMLQGFGMIKELISGTENFMQKHGFKTLREFVGKSLEFFTTHAHLVELRDQAREAKAKATSRDAEWSGEKIAKQTHDLATN